MPVLARIDIARGVADPEAGTRRGKSAMRESTSEVGRSAMRKALWRIVPLIALAYLCAYTDRVNVGFAAARMNADLGFSATVYG